MRFKLLEPTEMSYYVQIGGYIHVEPWRLPATVFPAGADTDRSKRVGSGVFTDWFDLGKYAGTKLHSQLNRAGGIAEFPNVTANFVTRPAARASVAAHIRCTCSVRTCARARYFSSFSDEAKLTVRQLPREL